MLEYSVILENGVISVESVSVNGASARLYVKGVNFLVKSRSNGLHSAPLIASELTLSSFISFYNKVIKPEYLQD